MTFTPDSRTPPPYRRDAHVDRSQETYTPSPYASRHTPPSGKVTPDGKRAHPQPGTTSKVLVWGGIGLASAAALLAVRAVVDAVAGDDEDEAIEAARRRARARGRHGHPKPRPMPRNAYSGGPRDFAPRDYAPRDYAPRDPARRFAELEEPDHGRARDDARREDRARIEAQRRSARNAPPRRAGIAGDFTHQVEDVTRTIRNALATVTAAIEGFRSVSGQAASIMGEFRGAADTLRTMFDRPGSDQAAPSSSGPGRMVDLRDGAETAGDQKRSHRL